MNRCESLAQLSQYPALLQDTGRDTHELEADFSGFLRDYPACMLRRAFYRAAVRIVRFGHV